MPDPYKEVIIVVTVSMVVLLTFSVVVVFTLLFYQRNRFRTSRKLMEMENHLQQEILKVQLETQEDTARRIGEDLHDNVGQLLSTTTILLGMTERNLASIPDTLITAQETLRKAIHDLRLLSKSLDKEWLTQFDLIENLETEISRINAAKVIETKIYSSEKILSLASKAQIILFRVIQEVLQNAIKHSGASTIEINILARQEQVEILVKDDGQGLNSKAFKEGMGFLNVRNRIKLLKGSVEWISSPGKGTEVHIITPAQTN